MTQTIAQQLKIKDFPFEIRDKNDEVIYFENSRGWWWKKKFDSNGKEIYFESSSGFWSKREYDDKGKEIYYEDSNGTIRDSRPKPPCDGKVVEIDGKKYKLTQV